jgi:hypothetical protein
MRFGVQLLLGALVSSFSQAAVADADDVTLDNIRQAWSRRQARVESARFQWTEWETTIKHSLVGGPETGGVRLPEVDTTNEHRLTLTIGAESRVRYERKGLYWSVDESKFADLRYVSTFDGTSMKSQFWKDLYKGKPAGFVEVHERYEDGNYHIAPVILAFRPLVPRLSGFDFSDFRLLDGKTVINGKPCVAIERTVFAMSIRYFLDPEQEFVVLRQERAVGAVLKGRMDISYSRDPILGPIPSSWDCTEMFSDGSGVDSTVKSRMDSQDLQIDVPEQEFDLKFEPGSVVVDDKKAEIYGIDAGGMVEPLRKSPPAPATGWRRFLIAANLVLISGMLAGGLVWYRKRRAG